MSDNVDRIQQLSLDLLNIAKPGLSNFQSVDPNQPLKAVYDLMHPQAEQFGLTLTLEMAKELVPQDLDTERMHRALLNLVSNALDACLQGGECSQNAEIKLISKKYAHGVEYQVVDNCGGMDEAVQAKILKGFFTTKGSRGTGIGLMLTRKIVEAHKGEIAVESEPGRGSKFVIRLPAGR